jgi:transposase
MRSYSGSHAFTCGIDLHGRTLYVCVLDGGGQVVLHRNLPCKPEAVLEALAPFRGNLVVGCERMFCWYWLADLCEGEGIAFVLGHALGIRLIHGTKTKSDKLDSEKIARLLRSGHLPLAYTYPRALRATRDLRRRLFFVRRRSKLLSHLQVSQSQYTLERSPARLDRASNRAGLAERSLPARRASPFPPTAPSSTPAMR